MKRYSPPDVAWYALRRTLPPWSWERNLQELLDFCRECWVDEVIVKVDTEEFSHGQVPPDWLEAYVPALGCIRDALMAQGVFYSLNPWITLGHQDRGRDSRDRFPAMQMMVGHDGAECRACACPLSETWREHTVGLWRQYAATNPAVLWVEDDIRTFNHSPARYGCFCPLHLKAFADRMGEKVKREQLVAALLAPGQPHPWRGEWLGLLGGTMIEVAGTLSEAVHEVSPDTLLGLMSSGPDQHCLEGRRWAEFAQALQGQGERLCSRPPLGIYSESSLRDFYYGAASIRKTRRALPPGLLEQTEVENVPFSTFSKSAAITAMQLNISFALGCHGATMNLFDHLGNPLADTPEFGAMLAAEKDFLSALARQSTTEADLRGVGILQRETASLHRRLEPDGDYAALADDGMAWAHVLEALGVGVTWQTESAEVLALSGQTVRAFSAAEIRGMLRGGVLCDLSAAQALADLGFGRHLGVTVEEVRPIHGFGPLAAEALTDPDFGGAPGRYLTATVPDLGRDLPLGRLRPASGTRVVSQLVDADGRPFCPLLALAENSLGGRVAVLAYDLTRLGLAPSFLHPYRRAQLTAVLEWLGRGPLPVSVEAGAYCLPLRADEKGCTRITLFNLSLDPWPMARLRVATGGASVTRVSFLEAIGRWRVLPPTAWQESDDGTVTITHRREITFRRPAAWRIVWLPVAADPDDEEDA